MYHTMVLPFLHPGKHRDLPRSPFLFPTWTGTGRDSPSKRGAQGCPPGDRPLVPFMCPGRHRDLALSGVSHHAPGSPLATSFPCHSCVEGHPGPRPTVVFPLRTQGRNGHWRMRHSWVEGRIPGLRQAPMIPSSRPRTHRDAPLPSPLPFPVSPDANRPATRRSASPLAVGLRWTCIRV